MPYQGPSRSWSISIVQSFVCGLAVALPDDVVCVELDVEDGPGVDGPGAEEGSGAEAGAFTGA